MLTVPEFTGIATPGQPSIDEWLFKVDMQLELLQTQPARQLITVALRLAGPALAHYRRVRATIHDLDDLKDALRATFQSVGHDHSLRRQLLRLQQRNNTVDVYYAEFSTSAMMLDNLGHEESVNLFFNGLRPELQYKLVEVLDTLDSLSAIHNAAREYEQIAQQQRQLASSAGGQVGSQHSPRSWQHQAAGGRSSARGGGTQITCYNCGRLGHRAVDCRSGARPPARPQQPRDQPGTPLPRSSSATCGYCQRAGHTTENCFARKRAQDSGRPSVNILLVPGPTQLLNFKVIINDIPVLCVVDSAAQLSLMDPEQATFLNLELVPTNQEIGSLFTNLIVRPLLTTTTTVAPMSASGSHGTVLLPFFIVPLASTHLQSRSGVNVILGLDWLRAVGAVIDTGSDSLTFKGHDLERPLLPPLAAPGPSDLERPLLPPLTASGPSDLERPLLPPLTEPLAHDDDDLLPPLVPANSPNVALLNALLDLDMPALIANDFDDDDAIIGGIEEKIEQDGAAQLHAVPQEIRELLARYPTVLPVSYDTLPRMHSAPEYNINLRADAMTPIWIPPFRRSSADRAVLAQEINKLMVAGIIRLSTSPWSAPT